MGEETGAGAGWFIQQIIKLASNPGLDAGYLTLDADRVCVRTAAYDELVHDGRAAVVVFGNCVWAPEQVPEWSPEDSFARAFPFSPA